jgi:hypothetical protein
MSKFYAEIDWTRAWFASIRPAAQQILQHENWRLALNQYAMAADLRNHRDLQLGFIPQEDLPDGVAYESHISDAGKIPTRENLHDFFNALVWLSFPKIKRQLNALQASQISTLGVGKSRGPARDAATIFDENSALLIVEKSACGSELLSHLHAHEWRDVLYDKAAIWEQHAELWSFGHALMEKLVQPYKAITAHTWVVWTDAAFFSLADQDKRAWIDQAVAQQLSEREISTADYTPLPVLGVPGWWPQQDLTFYADTQVFRPKRCVL